MIDRCSINSNDNPPPGCPQPCPILDTEGAAHDAMGGEKMRRPKNIMGEPLPLTIAALESALMKSEARLAPIREVYERYRGDVPNLPYSLAYIEPELLPWWFQENSTAAVDCWQAIKQACEEERT